MTDTIRNSMVNWQDIKDRIGDDEGFIRELAEIFLEDCPTLMEKIEKAIHTVDFDSLAHAAHTLKGAVGNFGAEPIHKAASKLEKLGAEKRLDDATALLTELKVGIHQLTAELSAF